MSTEAEMPVIGLLREAYGQQYTARTISPESEQITDAPIPNAESIVGVTAAYFGVVLSTATIQTGFSTGFNKRRPRPSFDQVTTEYDHTVGWLQNVRDAVVEPNERQVVVRGTKMHSNVAALRSQRRLLIAHLLLNDGERNGLSSSLVVNRYLSEGLSSTLRAGATNRLSSREYFPGVDEPFLEHVVSDDEMLRLIVNMAISTLLPSVDDIRLRASPYFANGDGVVT